MNSGIQPLQNLSVLRSVQSAKLPPSPQDSTPIEVNGREFAKYNIAKGLVALEAAVASVCPAVGSVFAAGTTEPTMADMCIIPQLYNARRFGIDLAPYPTLLAVESRCVGLPEFVAADAAVQPDAQQAK